MFTSHLARRRRLGALMVGFCVIAGSAGTAALADGGSSGSGASVSVDASVLVQAGTNPIAAQQAATAQAVISTAAQRFAEVHELSAEEANRIVGHVDRTMNIAGYSVDALRKQDEKVMQG